MAKKTTPATKTAAAKTLAFKNVKSGRPKSLIEWQDPSHQAHILDWRRRAHDFGLNGEGGARTEETPFAAPPERILREEEPEAFEPQDFRPDDHETEELEREE